MTDKPKPRQFRSQREWAAILEDAEKRGIAPATLAEELGTRAPAILKVERTLGIRLSNRRRPDVRPRQGRKNWKLILSCAVRDGRDAAEIAAMHGVHRTYVYLLAKQNGVTLPSPPPLPTGKRRPPLPTASPRSMTAQEFRDWRKALGLSRSRAALLLGTSPRSIEHYETGREIPLSFAWACAAIWNGLNPWDGSDLHDTDTTP